MLAGFDEEWFRARLDATPVGLSVASDERSAEGAALADLVVRLLARVYPRLALVGPAAQIGPLAELATAINPNIDLLTEASLGIAVGDGAPFARTIHAGSDGWDGLIGDTEPQPVGSSENPLGAGVAACLAAAALFRAMFLPESTPMEGTTRFSALSADAAAPNVRLAPWSLDGDAVLVGAGAVGQGALWALSRAPLSGRVHVVDMEVIELSNLQRYVLTQRSDEGRSKVEIAATLSSSLEFVPHLEQLSSFLDQGGYRWDAMLLALDSARDRVGAQASLPRFVANAWTQPGDLGVTSHSRFGGPGACVACLYLPDGPRKNEDELVAETLGVPELLPQIRTLLATGQPIDRGLLEAVAHAVGQPVERMLPFEQRTLRELYVEGFCGGAAIPIGDAGRLQPAALDVHVPLAHQSALAGVLLASALVRLAASGDETVTHATRVDVLRSPGDLLRQPLRARRDGRCICDDPDFVSVYDTKYVRS
ncbi:MAG: ThiF family adenylyltransferase [Solirubrobacteraceae bacterium]